MEDPTAEITDVVKSLTTTQSPEVQLEAIQTWAPLIIDCSPTNHGLNNSLSYFTPNAAFDHPLAKVLPGSHSRQRVVGLYQWYKIMSPNIALDIKSIAFDEETNTLFLDIEQVYHSFLSPFSPHPARLTTKMDLVKGGDGLYRIAKQTDYYQPEDLGYLTIPFISPFISLVKQVAGIASGASAIFFQATFGWWTGSDTRRSD
ncbi:hypothetical protein M407DRAFT_91885 [Tulasnella calospora MUT 4182]|uniref:SigF-like NTF2-like domain-containing protein n=1 Tax=Tulasnella calospora MUT 4182 TaxID=1051891 RepID=A0A0C3KVK4_9AGAM|nr:hypothetical protein M407DRAFT_91885 [Tulasnella calospora MUT 4182]